MRVRVFGLCIISFFLIFTLCMTSGCSAEQSNKSKVLAQTQHLNEQQKLDEARELFRQHHLEIKANAQTNSIDSICKKFSAGILSSDKVRAVEPVVRGESYADKKFKNYHSKCSNFKLNYIRADHEAGMTTEGNLLKNFKGYSIKGSDAAGNAHYLFYAEGFKPKSENSAASVDFAVGGYGGRYTLADLNACQTKAEYNVPTSYNYNSNSKTDGSSMLVEFEGDEYLLVKESFTIVGTDDRKKETRIHLIDLSSSRSGFHPADLAICTFQ